MVSFTLDNVIIGFKIEKLSESNKGIQGLQNIVGYYIEEFNKKEGLSDDFLEDMVAFNEFSLRLDSVFDSNLLRKLFDLNKKVITRINKLHVPGERKLTNKEIEYKALLDIYSGEIALFSYENASTPLGKFNSLDEASGLYNYAASLYFYLGKRLKNETSTSRKIFLRMFELYKKAIDINMKQDVIPLEFIKTKYINFSHKAKKVSDIYPGTIFLEKEAEYENKVLSTTHFKTKEKLRAYYNVSKAYYEIGKRVLYLIKWKERDGKGNNIFDFSDDFKEGKHGWAKDDIPENILASPDTLFVYSSGYMDLGRRWLREFLKFYDGNIQEIGECAMSKEAYYSKQHLEEWDRTNNIHSFISQSKP